jgi:glycosyltransferase involved in cell wall biosynthesis
MNTADVLILPMKSFGRPYLGIATKLYEYQAIGKPIICCGDGEQAKYIEETNSGIVVKPGDYKAIASTVIYLSKNPNLANRLGKNGRNYVVNKLSLNAIGLEMKVILKNLTNT